MNGGDRQINSSGDERKDGTAAYSPSQSLTGSDVAFDAAFDAAFLRLQVEVDQKPDMKSTRRSKPDPWAPLIALLRAAAEKIMYVLTTQLLGSAHMTHRTLIVEADQVWHRISNAISGQTWGETNSEARKAIGKLRRDFRVKPFSKIDSRVEMSCKCLMFALEEEPKQHVMWYEADRGAPSFEEGCEMDSGRLTVLMDAATDRLRIIRWDLQTMQDELTGSVETGHFDDQAAHRQSETVD